MPAPYVGYLLTTQQVALRTGANTQDESILATLPADTLLKAISQTYVKETSSTWHHVDVYNSGNGTNQSAGFVPDSAVTRISPTEAEKYMKTPTPSPQPVVTQAPSLVTGYAITLGDNVLLRDYPDTNAKISKILAKDVIVMVNSQEYVLGTAWHLVSYSGLYGYIRADQLRLLSAAETKEYLSSLKRTEPPVQTTPEPLTPNSLSSYGYINADNVRLRKEAGTNATVVKMMNKNAFALVLGSIKASDGAEWYRINQNGTDGYVMSRFLTVLKLGELQKFLQSNDFLSSNSTGSSSGTTNITPVEDHNKTVWQNPTIQASYEPFNPLATATPPVEAIMSPQPIVTDGDFVVEESPTLDPLTTFEPLGTDVPVKSSTSGIGGWVAVGLLGILGGGGYYGWRLYQDNQRKAAQRAAQRRQQAARQTGSPTTAQPGQTSQSRPAGTQPRPGQAGQQGSPYAPPRPGQTPPAQGITAYRPINPQQPGQMPPTQGTTAYRPATPQQPGQMSPTQGTTAYRPATPQQPGQMPPTQGTTAYRPATPQQPGQTVQTPDGTTAYRPITPQQPGQPAPGTASGQAGQGVNPAQKSAQNGQGKQNVQTPDDKPSTSGQSERRRRTSRHTGDDKA